MGRVATTLKGRWRVESPLPYMSGWLVSDVSIRRKELIMATSSFWQAAVTKALFGWSDSVGLGLSLTLESPKLVLWFHASADVLNEAVRRDAEKGWLKLLGIEARSWRELKHKVAEHWGVVVEAVKKRLESVEVTSGFDLTRALKEMEGLKSKLDDDKVAREVMAPALLLVQAEKLGSDEKMHEAALSYLGTVLWGEVGGDGYVSAAEKEVSLASGKDSTALLWAATSAAYGVKPRVRSDGKGFEVRIVNDGAVRLAQLYVLFSPPMLEEEGFIDHKLVEAVELGSKVPVQIEERSWRLIKGGAAVDLHISVDARGKFSIYQGKFTLYLREYEVRMRLDSTNRKETELGARLLKLAGVETKVKVKMVNDRNVWYIDVATDKLAEGSEELRRELVKAVEQARKRGWIDEGRARRWIEKFERGISTWRGYKFGVRLSEGALVVVFHSTNTEKIVQLKQGLESLGLLEGEHFTVTWPEEGKTGFTYLKREDIVELACIAIYGTDEARRKEAASLIEHLRERAEAKGKDVLEKLEDLIKHGEERGFRHATRMKEVVEIEWEGHRTTVSVEVKEIHAEEDGDKLRISVTAVVSGVEGRWEMTFLRREKVIGYTATRADAPGGREEDAERIAVLIKAPTGEEPNIIRRNGKIKEI